MKLIWSAEDLGGIAEREGVYFNRNLEHFTKDDPDYYRETVYIWIMRRMNYCSKQGPYLNIYASPFDYEYYDYLEISQFRIIPK